MVENTTILYAFGSSAEAGLFKEVASQLNPDIAVHHLCNGLQLLPHLRKQSVKPVMIVLECCPSTQHLKFLVSGVREEAEFIHIPFVIFLSGMDIPSAAQAIVDPKVFFLPKPGLPSELKYYVKLMLDTIGYKKKESPAA